jgi:3-phosphoshikimate 1-carboxyvinyltransferase
MDITIQPTQLGGTVQVPPSKSISHRALICAALAAGTSAVENLLVSEDITATCEILKQIGAGIENINGSEQTFQVTGRKPAVCDELTLDCHESGSTLRFLMPLATLCAKRVTFVGRGRLPERPLLPYRDIFKAAGIKWEAQSEKVLPLTLEGAIRPGDYEMSGNVSSQFISGLLFALPLLDQPSTLTITTVLESRPYVDLTLNVLSHFGIEIEASEDRRHYSIPGKQHYKPAQYQVEGDFSQAAFWLAMGVNGKGIRCTGLPQKSFQGDSAIIDLIRQMGGEVVWEDGAWAAKPSGRHGITMDVAQCPDLMPVLAVLAATAEGESKITGAGRLRLKESDRLTAMAELLRQLGIRVEEAPEGMTIWGKAQLQGGAVDTVNDHRIAMAAAVASERCSDPLTVQGAEAVRKSYPDFWDDFKRSGGIIA